MSSLEDVNENALHPEDKHREASREKSEKNPSEKGALFCSRCAVNFPSDEEIKFCNQCGAPVVWVQGGSLKRVLLIDDAAMARKKIGALLQQLGCQVTEASDGFKGLSLAQKLRPDLIVLDVQMPKMSGLEMLHKLRQDRQLASTPVVMMTVETDARAVSQALSLNITDYIRKDASLPDQIARLRKQVQAVEGTPLTASSKPEPPSAPAKDPPYDRAELMERVDNDQELLQHLVELFCRDYPQLVEEARQAIAAAEAHELYQAAHTLKGMLGNLSAHSAVQTALSLETAGHEEKTEEAQPILEQLEGELEHLAAALRA